MKILHAPYNVAGQPSVISRAQRKLGHESDVLVFHTTKYKYPHDYNIGFGERKVVCVAFNLLYHFVRSIFKYDIYHFYYATGFLPYELKIFGKKIRTYNLDIKLLKILGKKVVMQYVGSDIIQKDKALQYNIFTEDEFDAIYPRYDDKKHDEIIKSVGEIADITIVIDQYLKMFSPDSVLINLLVDVDKINFIGCKRNSDVINVLHAPTNRNIKGTSYIIDAFNKLKSEGYNLNLILVENKPHSEALELYKSADIVIDDINQGPYGLFALECMAMGKPVIGRINENFIKYYTDLPIVNANKKTIYRELEYLVEHPEICEYLGECGRKYVKKYHDDINIAKQLINIYESI